MPTSPLTLVLTRAWAFYLADGRCIAARDRRSGGLVPFHEAVDGVLLGSLPAGTPQPHRAACGGPRVGELLCVSGRRGLFCSGEILSLEMRSREALAAELAGAPTQRSGGAQPARPAGAARRTRPGRWQALLSALVPAH